MPWIAVVSYPVCCKLLSVVLAGLILLVAFPIMATQPGTETRTDPHLTGVKLTVVYDNNPLRSGMKTAWGFGCIVETGSHTLLFDTGGDGNLLLRNMETLRISPDGIDAVMISHAHLDHLGGLQAFLNANGDIPVYIPASFPEHESHSIHSAGATPVRVSGPLDLLPQMTSLGELSNGLSEQSAAILTPKGWVVITGCAHPGIVRIVQHARDILHTEEIYLILGGFHLKNVSRGRINTIVNELRRLGVEYVAPCHCSGNSARRIFREVYGTQYLKMGVGGIINISTEVEGGEQQ